MPVPTITHGWPWTQRRELTLVDGDVVCNPHYVPKPRTTVRQPITCGGCGANVSPKDERCDHCRAWLG